jgi:hypothetical protein
MEQIPVKAHLTDGRYCATMLKSHSCWFTSDPSNNYEYKL